MDGMIVAYGIYGDGIRFGVKSDGPDNLLKMPPLTASFSWPPVEDIKRDYPREDRAIQGQWCWDDISPL
jgi:hypothetical protein